MPIIWRLVKQIIISPYNGILDSCLKENKNKTPKLSKPEAG